MTALFLLCPPRPRALADPATAAAVLRPRGGQ